MHLHQHSFPTPSLTPHSISSTTLCISFLGIIIIFSFSVFPISLATLSHRYVIFLSTIFDSNEFRCSHKHSTVEQNAAIAAAATIATTDEAFVAFDCMNEEVPASTLHLISKYSCDTTPTHTFLDTTMAMQEQNDLEFPFLSTVANGEKYCWVEKDKTCSNNFTILRQISLMLPNAPYKFRNGNCASYFYFQPFIFVGDGKFSHWNSTLSTDTHTCGRTVRQHK